MTVRVGILGGGNISDTHARAALEIPGVEIVAMHGGNVERTRTLTERYGGELYPDLDGFLSHPMDVVLIGSPSGLHAEQATAAVRRGLHVLAEKPLDISTARIDALLAEAERQGVKLGVFFQSRAAPDLAWVKRLVESGGLGEPFLASAQVKWYRPPEYYADSRWRGTFASAESRRIMISERVISRLKKQLVMLLWIDAARQKSRARVDLPIAGRAAMMII